MHNIKRGKIRLGGRRGVEIVEFALVAPFFFLAFFGCVEVSWIMFNYTVLNIAAQEGAQVAARTNSPADIDTAIQNSIHLFMNQSLTASWQMETDATGKRVDLTVSRPFTSLVGGVVPMIHVNSPLEARRSTYCEWCGTV